MFKLVKNKFFVISLLITIGVLFKLALTENGNFLFNMDSARDFVDVREMVQLNKLRLIGSNTAIEGLYNGPFWYYLLVIPFVLSDGDPYSAIILEIILWVIGGFFLLKLVSRWHYFLMLPISAIWVASNYIVLANLYSFNPTPVMLLTPLFIYLLVGFLEKGKALHGILAWFLGGLFFNFEMNFGVFVPVIIFISVILTRKFKLLKQKWFWVGLGCFIIAILPQVIFDFKHQFIMTQAILRHLSENSNANLNFPTRFQTIAVSFYNTFLPILLNHKILTFIILLLFIPLIFWFTKTKKKDITVYVSLIFIFIPFFGYLFLPVTISPWHLGGEMAASLILVAFLFKKLMEGGVINRAVSLVLSSAIILFGLINVWNFFFIDHGKPNLDPSLFKNEIAVIDYVYQKAEGRNFKVYTYLPSIYDYPYQYLFWWYGQRKYGYIPGEYAYAPNKPSYIPSQDKFQGRKDNLSGLVFLIKEPNRGYNWKSGWEADYRFMKLLSSEKLGSIEIEIRRE